MRITVGNNILAKPLLPLFFDSQEHSSSHPLLKIIEAVSLAVVL